MACVALFGLALSGCSDATTPVRAAGANQPKSAAPEVQVIEATSHTWPEKITVQGSLMSDETSVVSAKIAGRVERVKVDLGSVVREGQPLVVLDSRELEIAVQQAEAQLAQACAAVGLTAEDSEADLKRENSPPVQIERALLDEARAALSRGEQLRARSAISPEEFNRLDTQVKASEARYKSALNDVGEAIALIGVRRAELALARRDLAEAQVLAPFDGIVERRRVSPGEYVQVGDAVATLVRADKLRFTAGVPERTAARIRPGQAVSILVNSVREPLVATVTRVSPSVDPSSRALTVEADVANAELQLRAGLFAEAEIVIDPAARALTLPASAVREFAGIQKVWVVEDGQAAEHPVRLGRRDRTRVEVLDGLEAGDLVVTDSKSGQAGPVVAVRHEPRSEAQPTTNTDISDVAE